MQTQRYRAVRPVPFTGKGERTLEAASNMQIARRRLSAKKFSGAIDKVLRRHHRPHGVRAGRADPYLEKFKYADEQWIALVAMESLVPGHLGITSMRTSTLQRRHPFNVLCEPRAAETR